MKKKSKAHYVERQSGVFANVAASNIILTDGSSDEDTHQGPATATSV